MTRRTLTRRGKRRLLVAIIVVAAIVFICGSAGLLGGAVAGADALRPLPPGVAVVDESTDADACPGNGNGWFLCHRSVRLRNDPGRADDLLTRAVEHYRAQGHRLEPLDQAEVHRIVDGPEPRRAFGRPGCLDDGLRGRVRCLIVLDRPDPSGEVIEVSMLSWLYQR